MRHRSAIARKRNMKSFIEESKAEDYVLSESNSSSDLDNNMTDRGSTSIIKLQRSKRPTKNNKQNVVRFTEGPQFAEHVKKASLSSS